VSAHGDVVFPTARHPTPIAPTRSNTAARVRTLGELEAAGVTPEGGRSAYASLSGGGGGRGGLVGEAAWDAATERERRMDDWKDGVPKGAGVTKRI